MQSAHTWTNVGRVVCCDNILGTYRICFVKNLQEIFRGIEMAQLIYSALMLLLLAPGPLLAELPDTGQADNAGEVDAHTLSETINSFSYKLVTQLSGTDPARNVVVGSSSVFGLLAMILLGTGGATYAELSTVLGFSQDIHKHLKEQETFCGLMQSLKSGDNSTFANAVFVDVRERLRTSFKQTLQRLYAAEALPVDFRQEGLARDLINDWVSNHTERLITSLLPDVLPRSTKMVLLNAHHFAANWAKPFASKYTTKMPFHSATGKVETEMMLNSGRFKYVFSPKYDCQMLAMPYVNETSTMYVLKGRANHKYASIDDVLSRLNWSTIETIIDEMTEENTVIRFPKTELTSNSDLASPLKAIGVKSIFDDTANFDLMLHSDEESNRTENEGKGKEDNQVPKAKLRVDSIRHAVKIKIDETGTQAAAATAAVMSRSAYLFYANTPFYFFIRNEESRLVTFSGIVRNPTQ